MPAAYLILENGAVFEGRAFGHEGEAVGELVFNTGMAGYLETLTDPCCFGQIVLQTFPLIGNYGVISSDFQSDGVHLSAYIVRQWCQQPSNFRSEGALDTFLRDHRIPGLYGLDTRALTHVIRENGAMNALVSPSPELTPRVRGLLREYAVRGGVENVSVRSPVTLGPEKGALHLALWDFGAGRALAGALAGQGFRVTLLPWDTAAEKIAALSPDGLILTDGPGDPKDNPRIIDGLRALWGRGIPLCGLGLGHQLLALSRGADTFRLRHGHRGANQPVVEAATGRVYATTQNHGYAVAMETLPETAQVTFANCNDETCEGLSYRDGPGFSVQFQPGAYGGALDTAWLLGRFIPMMEEAKKNAAQ